MIFAISTATALINFIYLHDDDYVVIALPFDDVTDNLSDTKKKEKEKERKKDGKTYTR
jgi:hypothetical protein